ncbi:MAG: hypothetical protein U0L83_02575 [Muribaculaceae bacterium]|nr:hypothetical protein [Muribaculaceae bacterium]
MRHHYTLALSLLLASGLALAVDKVVELRPQSATPSLTAPADAASPLRSHADPDGAFRADIEATLNVSPALSVAGNLSQP